MENRLISTCWIDAESDVFLIGILEENREEEWFLEQWFRKISQN